MKVLQLRSSMGFFGAEAMILELAKELSKTNYEPIIGVINNTYNPHLEMIDVAKKNAIKFKVFECCSQIDFRSIIKLRNYLIDERIAIIHSHGHKANIYALLASLFLNVKKIASCHPWIESSKKMKVYSSLDKKLLRNFDWVVPISYEVQDEIYKYLGDHKKISMINNGINVERFQKKYDKSNIYSELNIKPGSIILGTIGRLAPEKGHNILLRAASAVVKKFQNVKILIIGDGTLNEELEKLSTDLDFNDEIFFTGIRSDIPQLLNIIDIFILPSLSEGLPMALLEAMASKKPIIASRVGKIPEILEDGVSGILVEPGSISELVNAMKSLISNEKKRITLAEKAYRDVRQKFSSTKMASEYIQLYDRIKECPT